MLVDRLLCRPLLGIRLGATHTVPERHVMFAPFPVKFSVSTRRDAPYVSGVRKYHYAESQLLFSTATRKRSRTLGDSFVPVHTSYDGMSAHPFHCFSKSAQSRHLMSSVQVSLIE